MLLYATSIKPIEILRGGEDEKGVGWKGKGHGKGTRKDGGGSGGK